MGTLSQDDYIGQATEIVQETGAEFICGFEIVTYTDKQGTVYAASLSGYKYFLTIHCRTFEIEILSFFIQRRSSEYVHQEYSF